MTVVISLLHRLIILERTSSRGANWVFKYTQVFPSNKFSPLHRNRPKAVKNIRKIRAISYELTEKPHTNQRLWEGAKGGRLKGQGDGECGTEPSTLYVLTAPVHCNADQSTSDLKTQHGVYSVWS